MFSINFAIIHKLVFEISCLQKSITHRHTDTVHTTEYIIICRSTELAAGK